MGKYFIKNKPELNATGWKPVEEIDVHCVAFLVDFMTNFATDTYSHLNNENCINIPLALKIHNPSKV